MQTECIVRLVANLPDGSSIVEHPDGRLERRKSKTDWARLDAMSDEDIERSIADDPDWAPFKDIDWSTVEPVHPRPKTPISIRLDPEVLDFFKAQGPGYQRRINAVLRHYVKEVRRTSGAKAKRRRAG